MTRTARTQAGYPSAASGSLLTIERAESAIELAATGTDAWSLALEAITPMTDVYSPIDAGLVFRSPFSLPTTLGDCPIATDPVTGVKQ